jgi:hypothetical protein
VLATLQEWLASPDLAKDVTLQLMAAQVYLSNGRLKDALALVANDTENLEKSVSLGTALRARSLFCNAMLTGSCAPPSA